MIQPKDFRIGNYVMYEGKVQRFLGINQEFPLFDTDEYGVYATSWDKVEPIFITEEKLIELGFVNKRSYYYLPKLGNEYRFRFFDSNNKLTCSVGDNFSGIKYLALDYIHELQNLIYTFSKQELQF
jgi:translation elongation factor P/translation initiation factor 5A